MSTSINFDDLLASVEALNKQIKEVESAQSNAHKRINTYRAQIDTEFDTIERLEENRRQLQDSIASISMAMARTITENKDKYITAYEAIQNLDS